MATGPGKYDDFATVVRIGTSAKAVIVIVVEGDKGSGFSVQAQEGMVLNLPAVLRRVADTMEAVDEENKTETAPPK